MGGVRTSFFDGLTEGQKRDRIEAIAYVRLYRMREEKKRLPKMSVTKGSAKAVESWKKHVRDIL